MKDNKKNYPTPTVDVVVINVEQGFNGSIDKDPTRPGENPDMPGEDTEW